MFALSITLSYQALRKIAPVVLLAITLVTPAAAGSLTLLDVSPTPQNTATPVDAAITLQFDRPIERTSIVPRRSFWAFGRWSGAADGVISYANGDRTVILQPTRPFSAGERVMVVVSNQVQATDGSFLRDAGYSFQFWSAAQPAPLVFAETDRFSTNTSPDEVNRCDGGLATDLNGDGFLDISVVNNVPNDIPVFLNQADGSATFDDMLPNPTSAPVSSPNIEASDFNADGHADVALASDSIFFSILLGQGDGTFGALQSVTIEAAPHDVAVLDVDGDGDVDIVTSGVVNDLAHLLINDGNGVFTLTDTFGTNVDWAMAAADMNEDGILDLVTGSQFNQTIQIYTGNGDATFDAQPSVPSGGSVWMLSTGDVDGDGSEDVAVANSTTNNGAILIGNGAGGLGVPMTYTPDNFVISSVLGDLDGDGDLDWVTSSFGGDWFVFANDGSGLFAFNQEIQAAESSAHALAFDADNDGDLDLGLIDEFADEVIVMAHPGEPILFADGFESGGTGEWNTP